MSKAVIFFAPGFEECEGLLCVDLMRRGGIEVTTAAVGGSRTVKTSHGVLLQTDALAEELDYTGFDAVILPGGLPGVDNLRADATVRKVCTEFAAANKIVAAICAGPSVLASFGLLKGRKATVYPTFDKALTEGGADYTGLPLTLDGNIITGEALGAAIPFALALTAALSDRATADRVKNAIVYRY
ncbi:MAG: DJ-1 family glyoxalase III [Gemmiger sp.]|uniref:DJ-1 family glyoxalase III n=1 Tax=Gemmiger sp. TaxID=2049027 RepID=UPI002E79893E|nr:DJ-1 family glyoxalase III [Gemmiger sp.]MEE0799833.1 DJ-1 family glyoxalase III [Gemmiger sp.]